MNKLPEQAVVIGQYKSPMLSGKVLCYPDTQKIIADLGNGWTLDDKTIYKDGMEVSGQAKEFLGLYESQGYEIFDGSEVKTFLIRGKDDLLTVYHNEDKVIHKIAGIEYIYDASGVTADGRLLSEEDLQSWTIPDMDALNAVVAETAA